MAGAFPGAPSNLDLHTTDGGTVYQYKSDHGRWVIYKDAANLHVLKSGDIMSGDLIIDDPTVPLILKVAGIERMRLEGSILTLGAPVGVDTRLHIEATTGDDAQLHINGNDDSYVLLQEDANNRATLYYDAGLNQLTIKNYQAGDITEMQTTRLDVRNIADNDYADVNANAFNVSSQALPTDPENWKDLLPAFLKKEIVYPIKEHYTKERQVKYKDAEGKIQTKTVLSPKFRIMGEETRTFVSIDLVARFALQKVEALEIINVDLLKRIEELEKEVIK